MRVVLLCPAYSPATKVMADWCRSIADSLDANGYATLLMTDPALDRTAILDNLRPVASEEWVLVYLGHGRPGALVRKLNATAEVELLLPQDLVSLGCRAAYGFCCESGQKFGPLLQQSGGAYLGFWENCYANLRTESHRWQEVAMGPVKTFGGAFEHSHRLQIRTGLKKLKRHFVQRPTPDWRLHLMAAHRDLQPGNLRLND